MEYWLKFGFKHNGELACVRTLAEQKPSENFFYREEGQVRDIQNPRVIRLTKEVVQGMIGVKNENSDKL